MRWSLDNPIDVRFNIISIFYQTRGKMKPVQHFKGEFHAGNGTIDSNNSGR
jgi:hypothetical protein